MAERHLGARMKSGLRRALQRYKGTALHSALQLGLEELEPWRQAFLPYRPAERSYSLPLRAKRGEGLPVPPQELWVGYAGDEAGFLAGGREHVGRMRALCAEHARPLEEANRILELGCAAGRMLRWLEDLTPSCEVWGADISAEHVFWCKTHLCPPFHVLLCTTDPRLPFEDRSFGCVFAGSVFTHIDDLADAWFQELRRILCPGGTLYVTLHDKHSLALLEGRYADHWLASYLRSCPEYDALRRGEFGMFTIGRSYKAQVFYDLDWLLEGLAGSFRPLAIEREAYSYQTGVLLERI
ncbi:MAG: class I SAM-dependent methyltransferase [Planctomycetes bacterium]|nr:class I SAM-dependent methyltransferase [Planctomycetota bacterium]